MRTGRRWAAAVAHRDARHGERSRSAGFTYSWVLLVVAVMAIGLAAIGHQWSVLAEQQRRDELQWTGAQYVRAIGSYYEASPGGVKRYPPSMDELLQDSRFLVTRRHLRRLYPNPYTLRMDWELIRAPDGGLQGLAASSSENAAVSRFVYAPLQ